MTARGTPEPAPVHGTASPAFRTFWLAGFEGADHRNSSGVDLDLVAATGHAGQLRGDYRRACSLGIRTVRESVGWRYAMRGGQPDFSRAQRMADEAARQGIEIVWTLWHYGFPPDVDPFAPDLAERFADFCERAVRAIEGRIAPDAWFNPVNEISYLTYLLTETDWLWPYRGGLSSHAGELKRNLVRAAVRGGAAVRACLPRARLMLVDPVCHVATPHARLDLADEAARYRDALHEAWDLAFDPSIAPDVPVDARCDAIGVNHYHNSQWEVGTRRVLRWHEGDPRRRPLSALLADVHARYGRPVVLAETSHVGIGRADWLRDIAHACARTIADGVPLVGACVYPFVDRPDWERPKQWHESGVYDVVPSAHPRGGRRVPQRGYRELLRDLARPTHPARPTRRAPSGAVMDTVVVFSHLRWDSVFQRPQHIMSRFARRWRVLFVEEPIHTEGEARAELIQPMRNLTVLRPRTPIQAGGFHDDQLPVLRRLVAEAIGRLGASRYAVWTYTPMALPLVQDLSPCVIAYDCMDELAAFRFAPKQLAQRESALLRMANVVFTGGPSLYEARRDRHENVHCFPSSVDAQHFARGRHAADAHPDVAAVPGPRLGFYGVIDERFDAALFGGVAKARPDWQFFLVGPIVKIDRASLPDAPNVHYLPQQTYAALPSLLAGWDVCLLPFARNEATRFISPTKTLEYLAADKPVVSTSITDVVKLYGSAVRIADDPASFVAACEASLGESLAERRDRLERTRALVQRTSWDDTAKAMADLLEAAAAQGLKREAVTLLSGAKDAPKPARAPAKAAECLILGAGPTGLSAAYHYGEGATLLERGPTVGGWCRSIVDNGFTFDCAGHIMFSNDPDVQDLYVKLLGANVLWQDREAWVYSKGVHTRYPFQGALHGLPPDVLKECLLGAIEARYGLPPGAACSTAANPVHQDCCADGTDVAAGASSAPLDPAAPPRNFEEFIHRVWGRGIAKHFAIPYNRKLWAYPLAEMETSWLGGRVPLPDLEQMIDGALSPVPKPMGPNARFGYPLRGGFQALMDGFLPLIKGPVELSSEIVRVFPSRRQVLLADGGVYGYTTLVSTLPLPELVAMIDDVPAEIREAARGLRRVSVRCVNLGIGRPALTDKHWIYYPEDTIFHRIFVQGNASPHNNPPGGFGITCEISYASVKPLPVEGEALIRRCIEDCIKVGMIRDDDPIWAANEVDMPYAYVLYDHARQANVDRIRAWLEPQDILLAGRYSEWQYYNSDHAFLAGRKAARLAAERVTLARRSAVKTGSAA